MADFIETQHQLADAIRQPELDNSFEARRLKIYQELFFNNVEGFCAGAFPVLKSIVETETWTQLIRQFFVQHQCETPHFIEISQEFLTFLSNAPERLPHPALLELAHYEWVELASSVAENQTIAAQPLDFSGDSKQRIWLPESTWPLAYNHPVHTLSADTFSDIEASPTFLLVYRDQQQEIRFIETDQLTIWLLNQLQENELGMELMDISKLLAAEPLNLSQQQAEGYLRQALPALVERQVLAVR